MEYDLRLVTGTVVDKDTYSCTGCVMRTDDDECLLINHKTSVGAFNCGDTEVWQLHHILTGQPQEPVALMEHYRREYNGKRSS